MEACQFPDPAGMRGSGLYPQVGRPPKANPRPTARQDGSAAQPMPPAVAPQDELKDPLPVDPTLKSADDVGQALYELAWLDSREATIQTAADQRCALIRREAEAKLELIIRKKPISFADRRVSLVEAIRAFARDNAGELFVGGTKTREFTHGELSLRAQPSSVVFASTEKDAEEKTIAAIEKKAKIDGGFLAKIVGLLRRAKLWPECKAADLLDASVRVSKTKVKDALKSGRVTEQQLESVGLKIDRPKDKLTIDVALLPVVSESRQPAEAAA